METSPHYEEEIFDMLSVDTPLLTPPPPPRPLLVTTELLSSAELLHEFPLAARPKTSTLPYPKALLFFAMRTTYAP